MKRRTRRWGRILFNTLTAISLLLALATLGLWARSGFVADGYQLRCSISRVDYAITFRPVQGAMEIWTWEYSASGMFLSDSVESVRVSTTGVIRRFFPDDGGFAYRSHSERLDHFFLVRRLISFPIWIPVIAFLCLPLLRLVMFLYRGRGGSHGHCPACGYDTRANPAKCSECGLEIASR